MAKIGRPTDYTQELGEEICNTIACNSKGLKMLCKENEHWPCRDTIYSWRIANKEFADMYARAKQNQVELLVDEILEIADDTSNDYITNEEGKIIVDHDHIQRAKLKIDTRKWFAAKLAPRLYGDKTEVHTTIATSEEINPVRELTEKYIAEHEIRNSCK